MNYAASLDKSNPNSSWESHFKVKLEFDPLSQSFNKLSEPCAVLSTELFFSRLGRSLPPHPQVYRKLRSSPWPAQEQLLQNKGLALPCAASSLICQPSFSSLASTSSPSETPITVAIIPHPYKPSLWEVQLFFLGLCLVSPTFSRHLCSAVSQQVLHLIFILA